MFYELSYLFSLSIDTYARSHTIYNTLTSETL